MWTEQEIDDALGPERARVFKPHYFVRLGGNAVLSPRSDPHREFGGLNTLMERQSVQDTAKQLGDVAALLSHPSGPGVTHCSHLAAPWSVTASRAWMASRHGKHAKRL